MDGRAVPDRSTVRRDLHAWLESGPGRSILDVESRAVSRGLINLFGYHLVQVGNLAGFDAMAQSRVLHRLVVALDGDPVPAEYPAIRGRACSLAIDSDSVDVIVMPHVLEFEREPHDALREALRVLVPEGHLIIAGFNPWSLLGLWRAVPRASSTAPWRGQFLAQRRVREWLSVLGFEVLGNSPCFFKPPLRNQRVLRRLDLFEAVGARMLPMCSAAYVLVARKRVTTLTPIRPRWKPSRRLVAVGLARPSARASQRD